MSLIMAALNRAKQEAQTPPKPRLVEDHAAEEKRRESIFVEEEEFLRLLDRAPSPRPAAKAPARRSFPLLRVLTVTAFSFLLIASAAWAAHSVSQFWTIESVWQKAALQTAQPAGKNAVSPAAAQAPLEMPVFKGVPVEERAVLEGILLDESDPVCLINGKILGLGDTWEGHQIVAIGPKKVTLRDMQGQRIDLKARG